MPQFQLHAYFDSSLQKYFSSYPKSFFLFQNSQESFHPAPHSGHFKTHECHLADFSKTSKRNVLDHNIEAHKLCAYAIVVFTGIHFLAHLFNVLLLSDSYKSDQLLLAKLNTLFDGQSGRFAILK